MRRYEKRYVRKSFPPEHVPLRRGSPWTISFYAGASIRSIYPKGSFHTTVNISLRKSSPYPSKMSFPTNNIPLRSNFLRIIPSKEELPVNNIWFNILVEFCHHYIIQQTYLIKVQIISLNRHVGKECSVGTISVQEKLAFIVLSDVCQVKSSISCYIYHLDWNSLLNRLQGFSWQPIIAIHFKVQSIFSILEVFQQQIMQSELIVSCSEH